MKWNWIINLVAKMLSPLVGIVSTEIREVLVKFIKDFYARAEKTPNGWDDFLAELLAKIVGVDVTET